MRIWSIHPKYLDSKGLVALWRESLLARKVLQNETKGYKNHPQLNRFKRLKDPITAINFYLQAVWEEATYRDYKFDKGKLGKIENTIQIDVTTGQINFEKMHLLRKLRKRDKIKFNKYRIINEFDPHPLFTVIEGDVEIWEKI
ncbi:pyrimidine dimer DNA glycosylase/endonuclease V [Candidatus Cloacimonadota bacterium]